MVSALLITLREGLEAALIVGIVLGYLTRTGQRARTSYAWAGVAAAVGVSILAAFIMQAIGIALEEPFEQIFEGALMLLAVGVLTWMIFWMRYQARHLQSDLEKRVATAVHTEQNWGLFTLTFVAVVREGIETTLFLSANAFAADGASTFVGALLGLALAVAGGVLIYAYAVRLDVKLFFNITSFLLIVFAAGLLAHGIHEFQEIGWLPILSTVAWDTKAWLSDQSPLGALLRALVGYNDNPTLLEVAGYVAYWVIILQMIRWWTKRLATQFEHERA